MTVLEVLPSPTREAAARWDDAECARWAACGEPADLGRCVYVTRLLGADRALVLHGGGNSSVKVLGRDLVGRPRQELYVKGSGQDMATIAADGFSPLDLGPLRRLLELEALDDEEMLRQQRCALLDPAAPAPSVETLLHAFLPHRFVLHAHPEALLALLQTPGGAERARRLFEPELLVVPYVQPGFALARKVAELWQRRGGDGVAGLVLLHHGVFTFADDARTAWERLSRAVSRAAAELPPLPPARRAFSGPRWTPLEIAALRREISRLAERPLVVHLDDSDLARRFAASPQAGELVRRGPLTPDDVLRTRRTAALVPHPGQTRAVLARWARDYRGEYRRFAGGRRLRMLDPAPRLIVVPGNGIFAAGPTARAARIAGELYHRTVEAMLRAEGAGGFRPLSARRIFDMEYWAPEQAKLARQGEPLPLLGRVALVTGAAGGIGGAIVEALMAAGAAVAGVDRIPTPQRDGYLGIPCDVTAAGALEGAVARTVESFGGLDLVVAGAGVFPGGDPIELLDPQQWQRTLEVNCTSGLTLLRHAVPLLKLAPAGGSVVVVGSRNVLAPGPGAAAYSASKAALTQLARVAALELAPFGIRVNVVHPDGVFDTGLWTPEVLAARARQYGISVAQYRRRNLLHTEVTSRDVARLAVALCTDTFRCTTGAQIPVDGGDARVV
ncbi:MAG TPA: SDR family oxidoreductase [Thermoanaerobaculia bacterium]|nr:SDR family oxidoreductase [Thermoanaerobaculia bacterium]